MKILAHRGAWNVPEEKNTLKSFSCALQNNWGIESDVRDYEGELVIAHNIADAASPNALDVFELWKKSHGEVFAINIKADGLCGKLKEMLDGNGIKSYFCFDMSVPQMLEYRASGLRYFTRQSEFEKNPVLYEDAAGVWLDAFYDDSWLTNSLIEHHLGNEKEVCLVSPDLHQRDCNAFWQRIYDGDFADKDVYLCTDFPAEAQRFFYK